ncbi:sigma-70 family RNA polymerase sigma factor [Actinocorallia populi]|uniref:sigma-70 family RNA polymerase sigma factor n=1 Tax=Actinocorallia populi TaxID=2079200 RepID=UPI0013002614|nr:sigma-70 family RNA polymerase sigma factor [Actinocorallia populi]
MTPAELLWRAHAADLRRFLARRTACPQDAEDLLQEVFLRAVRTPPAEAGAAWLFTVARSVLADHYRRTSRRRETTVADLPEAQSPQAPSSGGTSPEVERAARCTAGMLERLPEGQREALRTVDMGGLAQNTAAQHSGMSVSGMKSRVQRGRAALRALVEACCPTLRDAGGRVVGMGPCNGPCGC